MAAGFLYHDAPVSNVPGEGVHYWRGSSEGLLGGDHADGPSSESTFFALVMRMRYIERWMLMRNTQPENLAEHSLDVAMMAHALCTLANVRYGAHLDANRAAVLALYHDAPEIITGDLPTPVKYFNEHTRSAYGEAEASATHRLLATLPSDIRPVYEDIMGASSRAQGNGAADADEVRLRQEVKAADKLSALVKCLQERSTGNPEFRSAEASTRASLEEMEKTMPELHDFLAEFLPSFEATLDELLQ